jgi:hypothetical protein
LHEFPPPPHEFPPQELSQGSQHFWLCPSHESPPPWQQFDEDWQTVFSHVFSIADNSFSMDSHAAPVLQTGARGAQLADKRVRSSRDSSAATEKR